MGRLSAGRPRFVVQRHRARRLHYDLRLEIGGVLVSWAVPKGPTLDPAVKRAAVRVEDHPIDYLEFEGVIPAGQYGGGDVIVWDIGTWETAGADDAASAIEAGELHAELHGHKLHGRFVLVRRRSPAADRRASAGPARGESWLLLHKRDSQAVAGWDPEAYPRSVLSGRTNEEVAAGSRPRSAARRPRAAAPAAGRAAGPQPGPAGPQPGPTGIAALDDLGPAGGTWEVFGRPLRVTNLDKELFPGAPRAAGARATPAVSKREFLAYTARVAPILLPYLAGRPLNMHRYPDGAGGPGFWHKQLPAHAPAWVPRWNDPHAAEGKTATYLVVDEPAALVWAANFGALEWHAWTSAARAPARPSYALIDLDPGSATSWEDVLVLARLHRAALEHLGVQGWPKLTGRRGIQIWIPIAPGPTFEQTRSWVEQLSRSIGAVVPELVSWTWEVAARGGRARLDYTQNAVNKTLVAPYSPRAAAGAPVSTPIAWDELDAPWLRPDAFTLRSVPARLAAHGDPFRGVLDTSQHLPALQ